MTRLQPIPPSIRPAVAPGKRTTAAGWTRLTGWVTLAGSAMPIARCFTLRLTLCMAGLLAMPIQVPTLAMAQPLAVAPPQTPAQTQSSDRADPIVSAHYGNPVERYGHFALGRPHEYAHLVAHTEAGRELLLELPHHEVFEDLSPRLFRLRPDAEPELLVIISGRPGGARVALIGVVAGQLAVVAHAPPIGISHRWLNPVGAVDLDGDGQAEIAAVTTPHIGGTLRVYRRDGTQLSEVARLGGFSNHVYGSPELGLSTTARIAGRPQLLIPDDLRTTLRAVALVNGRLVETGHCPLSRPMVDPKPLADCAATLNALTPAGSANRPTQRSPGQ